MKIAAKIRLFLHQISRFLRQQADWEQDAPIKPIIDDFCKGKYFAHMFLGIKLLKIIFLLRKFIVKPFFIP